MAAKNEQIRTKCLIIGSGIAGLRAAIELSRVGEKPLLITKSRLEDSNTFYAQGGIAAVDPIRVKSRSDSYVSHIDDTLKAGAGICDKSVVGSLARQSYKEVIQFLIDNGVEFTKKDGRYPFELHQEGGHSHERIYCVGDYTGRAVEKQLAAVVRSDWNIRVLENHSAIDLVTSSYGGINPRCCGAYVLDRETRLVRTISAGTTFLATGGAGRVFQYTSNPENATGDGIAMAYKAGARVSNLEFIQFHPTVLYEPNPEDPAEKRFLITEALRGEKVRSILTLEKEILEDLVLKYDPEGSHGTRDVVARAIDTEMKSRGLKHVWLNATTKATGKSREYLEENYPQIFAKLMEKGIDMSVEPIPVVPAAHYTCGGVVVDQFGLTDIASLYAIGEVACTGLMGANRLASNSLPEAALYGMLAVAHALINISVPRRDLPNWNYGNVSKSADPATMNQFWDMTRTTMTNLCGIDRNEERLQLAARTLSALANASKEIYWNHRPTHEIVELRNLTTVAQLIAQSALARKESRGCHYRSDFPERDEYYRRPSFMARSNL